MARGGHSCGRKTPASSRSTTTGATAKVAVSISGRTTIPCLRIATLAGRVHGPVLDTLILVLEDEMAGSVAETNRITNPGVAIRRSADGHDVHTACAAHRVLAVSAHALTGRFWRKQDQSQDQFDSEDERDHRIRRDSLETTHHLSLLRASRHVTFGHFRGFSRQHTGTEFCLSLILPCLPLILFRKCLKPWRVSQWVCPYVRSVNGPYTPI